MLTFLQTPLGLVCAIAAAILAVRCFGELLAFAARAAVVMLVLGVVAYFLGWQPPILSDDVPASPSRGDTQFVRWRI